MHRAHLSKDKKLQKIIQLQEPPVFTRKKNIYLHLCASIMSQQLSTKVAAVIYARFLGLFGNTTPSPEDILAIPFEELRSIGLSNSKTHYVRNVCEFFISEKITDKKLYTMSSADVMEKLVSIKGVGRWTVEMLLMFALGDEDVFAPDDLGIQQAMIKLYKLGDLDKKMLRAEMMRISAKWSPYRTYACRYLWNWKDKK